jgi:hypothetical protein
MVMFKTKFKPLTGKPAASAQQQQQPQPVPPMPREDKPKAPPIEKERGPQYPVKEPGPGNPPERAR